METENIESSFDTHYLVKFKATNFSSIALVIGNVDSVEECSEILWDIID